MNDMTHNEDFSLLGRPRSLHKTRFAWQGMNTTALIRRNFRGKRCATALAIYQALTECASEQGRLEGRHVSTFPAPIVRIAEKVDRSVSSIKRYAKAFRTLGILDWKNRRNGKMNKPNLWILLAPSVKYSEPTFPHNNERRGKGHNSEPAREEGIRISKYNKGESKDSRNTEGPKHIGDLMRARWNR